MGANIVDFVLDGVSQVIFIGSPLTGILFLIGLGISSLRALGWALLGSVTGGALAIALGIEPNSVYFGIWGFNSVLTAIALGDTFWKRSRAQFAMAVCGSFATAFVTATNVWFLGIFGLPVQTSAFVATSWIFLFASQKFSLIQPAQLPAPPKGQRQAFLNESRKKEYEESCKETGGSLDSDSRVAPLRLGDFKATGFIKLIFTGIAQVFFQESWLAGVFIFIGMTVATIPLIPFGYQSQYPIYFGGITCFIASLVGTSTAIALQADKTTILRGLYGFNSVLTAVAVMGIFLGFFISTGSTPGAPIMFGIMLFGSIFASIATAFLTSIFQDKWKVPTLTAPFVLTAWMIESASYLFPNIIQNLANLPTPAMKAIVAGLVNVTALAYYMIHFLIYLVLII